MGTDAEKLRTPFQKDLVHFFGSIQLYNRIKNSLEPEGTDDFSKRSWQDYQQSITNARAAVQNSDAGKPVNDQDLQHISFFFQRYGEMTQVALPMLVPPMPDQPRTAWSNVGTNLMDAVAFGTVSEPVKYYAAMSSAFNTENPAVFNTAVAQYRVWLQENGLGLTPSPKATRNFSSTKSSRFTSAWLFTSRPSFSVAPFGSISPRPCAAPGIICSSLALSFTPSRLYIASTCRGVRP